MYGWAGTILDLDLSSGRIEKKPFDCDIGQKYIGGRGVNAWLLYHGMKPNIDALGPENLLIIGTGPFGGTLVPTSARCSITAKSCHYDGMATSNVGGDFAPELKWAGYDHIIIRGKAKEPVYLWIDDDKVELKSASRLWGKDTWETERLVKEELKDANIKVGSIGQAGENLVKYASITFSLYRAAGQGGLGTIMGSKNLKAVAVRGTKSVRVAQPDRIKALTDTLTRQIMDNKTYPGMSVHGTPRLINALNAGGFLCLQNYQQAVGWDKERISNYSKDAISRHYTKDKACFSCPIHCSHYFEIKEGAYKGEKGGGIELGHILPLGIGLENSDLPSVFKMVNLCQQYGLDTMDFGFTLACAMEWYQRGIIDRQDTNGVCLEWGNVEAIIEMLRKVSMREGFGDLLADGAVHAAEKIGKGAIEYVNHCKGVPLGCDDPRLVKGGALNAATSTIPSHHEEGAPVEAGSPLPPELMKKLFESEIAEPANYKKAKVTIYYQNLNRAVDAAEICKFASGWQGQAISFDQLAELFSAATGMPMDAETVYQTGERINDLERAFAAREGMRRKDDHLNGRVAKEPISSGPFKGQRLDPQQFDIMLDEYYEHRGWDKETGIPTREKLESVGLDDIANDLESMDLIAPTASGIIPDELSAEFKET